MATGANATPLGKLHPSIGAKRGFEAGPGAGVMAPPSPPVSFATAQNVQQPPQLPVNFPQAQQFTLIGGAFPQPQQSQPSAGMQPSSGGGGKADRRG